MVDYRVLGLQQAEANDFLQNANTGAAGAKWRLGGVGDEKGCGVIGPKQDTY
ncbi:hypothetical protein WN55_10675 [Dufourea novaeangliae]|uniref:Uncharacterized protein n=1 Tax=Dufourea novaeangliae TaxID=178035 RepID=A0A154P989_DUFNO|nr:hypothetical protein WN55_10675 [Dufourea novaeangliae]